MTVSKYSPVKWGFLSGALMMISAHAAYWFVGGPNDASTTRAVLVGVQLVAAAGLALWAWRKGRERERRGGSMREATGV